MTSFDLLIGGYSIVVPDSEATQHRPQEAGQEADAPAVAPRELTLKDYSVEISFLLLEAVESAPDEVTRRYSRADRERACDKVRRAVTLRTTQARRDSLMLATEHPEFISEEKMQATAPSAAALEKEFMPFDALKKLEPKVASTGQFYMPPYDYEADDLAPDDPLLANAFDLAVADLQKAAKRRRAHNYVEARQAELAAAEQAAAIANDNAAKSSEASQAPADADPALTPKALEEKEQDLRTTMANLKAVEIGETVPLRRRECAFILAACQRHDHVGSRVALAKKELLCPGDLDELAQKTAEHALEVPIETILYHDGTLRRKVSIFIGRAAARMSKSAEIVGQRLIDSVELLGETEVYLIQ